MTSVMDSDFALALQLQEQFDAESNDVHHHNLSQDSSAAPHSYLSQTDHSSSGTNSDQLRSDATISQPHSLIDPSWDLIDPNPDARALFVQYNRDYFWGTLAGVEVRWSPRMTLCAGVCDYEGRGGLCSIRLSEPLLKLRPRKDLVETLLHEMIHAYLFVTDNDRDHDGHGPNFCRHMDRLNKLTGAKITIYHDFHDEVDSYRQHWWRCNGSCRSRKPFFGYVKRAMNRAPSSTDRWWADHQRDCGGTFVKIKEPEGYADKKAQKAKIQEMKNGQKSKEKKILSKWIKSGKSDQTVVDTTPAGSAAVKVKPPGSAAVKAKEPDDVIKLDDDDDDFVSDSDLMALADSFDLSQVSAEETRSSNAVIGLNSICLDDCDDLLPDIKEEKFSEVKVKTEPASMQSASGADSSKWTNDKLFVKQEIKDEFSSTNSSTTYIQKEGKLDSSGAGSVKNGGNFLAKAMASAGRVLKESPNEKELNNTQQVVSPKSVKPVDVKPAEVKKPEISRRKYSDPAADAAFSIATIRRILSEPNLPRGALVDVPNFVSVCNPLYRNNRAVLPIVAGPISPIRTGREGVAASSPPVKKQRLSSTPTKEERKPCVALNSVSSAAVRHSSDDQKRKKDSVGLVSGLSSRLADAFDSTCLQDDQNNDNDNDDNDNDEHLMNISDDVITLPHSPARNITAASRNNPSQCDAGPSVPRDDSVACPVCLVFIKPQMINEHLDLCLVGIA